MPSATPTPYSQIDQYGNVTYLTEAEIVALSDAAAARSRAVTPAYSEIDAFGNRVALSDAEIQRRVAASATQGQTEARAQAAASGATDRATSDAYQRLKATLDSYGLGSLADWAWARVQAGDSEIRILQDLRQRPEYKARFPGMAERRSRGLPAISEAEYIGTERSIRQMFTTYGLPSGFYDQPDDFARFIGRDVSLAELQARVIDGYAEAIRGSAEDRAELERIYGITPGMVAAFFIDEKRALPLIQRQFAAARLSGAATRTGFGGLTQTEAERLGALGVTGDEAQRGFGELIEGVELFDLLPGELDASGAVTRSEQLGAVFEGNAAARRKIAQRARRRAASFEGGGSFARSAEGVAGFGFAV